MNYNKNKISFQCSYFGGRVRLLNVIVYFSTTFALYCSDSLAVVKLALPISSWSMLEGAQNIAPYKEIITVIR